MELKPCPFCGGGRMSMENQGLKPASEKHGGEPMVFITCRSCGAEVYGWGETDAKSKWNKRT